MKNKHLILGGIAVLIAGGVWYGVNQVTLISKLKYSVKGYKIISISAEGARIDLTLAVTNESKLSLKVKKFKLNVFADDKFMATAYSDELLEIKPNDIGTTTVQVLINPKLMIRNIGAVLQDSSAGLGWKNIMLTLDGGLNVSKGGIPFYVPLKISFKLSSFTEK
jgi:hypothetical protein